MALSFECGLALGYIIAISCVIFKGINYHAIITALPPKLDMDGTNEVTLIKYSIKKNLLFSFFPKTYKAEIIKEKIDSEFNNNPEYKGNTIVCTVIFEDGEVLSYD